MDSVMNSKPALQQKLNYGRKRIILDYDEVTPENILDVFNKALPWHNRNAFDCDYLIHYYLGDQDILRRTPPETSNINNQVVVNYAYPITREIIGYTFGNPIEFIQTDVGKKVDVEKITDIYEQIGGYLTDTIVATYASICGVGYQITLPSEDISEEYTPSVPIKCEALHPSDTFCVFSSKVGNPQIMSCNIIRTEGGNVYVCYTNKYIFTINNKRNEVEMEPNPIGLDPITMTENAIFLTGDWEQAISVMNASNLIASDSLNDIEGNIRSLLVLLGAEFEDDTEGLSTIKKNRLLTLTSPQGTNVDAKFIAPQIESASIENIRQYLEDARNIITGIPDRQTASGGDTGTAVLNRNGWTDIEIVARLKELFFKKSKKKQLGIAIRIMQILGLVSNDLSEMDIKLTIGRHTTDNLQTKAQAFSTLVATGELATIDALEMSGLTNRINEVVERGEKAKEERQQQALEVAQASGANADTSKEENGKNAETKTDNTDN